MNKYNEVEIQTAKNLLKEGYKWIARSFQGSVGAFSCKPCKKMGGYSLGPVNGKVVLISGKFTPLFQSIKWEDDEPTYIEDIINPQILDDDEKRYLEGVIRPFRDRVEYIVKSSSWCNRDCCYIKVGFHDLSDDMKFPLFREDDMYKGMETGKRYTLEELGL